MKIEITADVVRVLEPQTFASGELTEERIADIAKHLRMNQTRPIDRPNWGKLELAKWMKGIWNL